MKGEWLVFGLRQVQLYITTNFNSSISSYFIFYQFACYNNLLILCMIPQKICFLVVGHYRMAETLGNVLVERESESHVSVHFGSNCVYVLIGHNTSVHFETVLVQRDSNKKATRLRELLLEALYVENGIVIIKVRWGKINLLYKTSNASLILDHETCGMNLVFGNFRVTISLIIFLRQGINYNFTFSINIKVIKFIETRHHKSSKSPCSHIMRHVCNRSWFSLSFVLFNLCLYDVYQDLTHADIHKYYNNS